MFTSIKNSIYCCELLEMSSTDQALVNLEDEMNENEDNSGKRKNCGNTQIRT